MERDRLRAWPPSSSPGGGVFTRDVDAASSMEVEEDDEVEKEMRKKERVQRESQKKAMLQEQNRRNKKKGQKSRIIIKKNESKIHGIPEEAHWYARD